MVEHPGMWAGILSLFRVGTAAGLMLILPMNRLGAGKHGVRAGLGKRLEYRKGANESTREPAHNIEACAGLFVARGFIPAGLRSGPKYSQLNFAWHTELPGFRAASQPSGDKSPRHNCVLP